jgi:integrase
VKDKLPLKESTRLDYLRFIKESKTKSTGRVTQPGELLPLADIRLDAITADQIRDLYDDVKTRSTRRANYAMTLLRALFNYFEVPIPENIFASKSRRRGIQIAEAGTSGKTIHPKQIGAWWAVLNEQPETDGYNYVRFLMLTGCRPSEPLGVKVGDIDALRQSIELKDTKNRKDHVLFLSRQAWEIVEKQMVGKAPDDKLFATYNGWKFAADIREKSGVFFTLKMLRASFASRAEPLVSTYCLKAMMNHANSADVTAQHYVDKTEEELRSGWQSVADYLDEQAEFAKGNVILLPVPA